eukprot:12867547-Alexandrium_andersonii.AAC.1
MFNDAKTSQGIVQTSFRVRAISRQKKSVFIPPGSTGNSTCSKSLASEEGGQEVVFFKERTARPSCR